MKIRRNLLGGYDSISVLKRIEKLNQEYQHKLENVHIKYEAKLEELDNEIEMLKRKKIK